MIIKDCQITIRDIAVDNGVSIGLYGEIFSSVLGMKRIAAKFVLRVLN